MIMYILFLFTLFSTAIAAPLIVARAEDAIAGKWIVKMKGDVATLAEDDLTASISSQPDYRYAMSGFRGFSGTLTSEELSRLQTSEHVDYIEQDARVQASTMVLQYNSSWGLSRISHKQPYEKTYLFDESAGEDTCAYVIDTGIEIENPEFQGRAFFVADFSGEDTWQDLMGHGTHVAGTIGSTTWGVAKKTTLYAVRVLDQYGIGTNAGVLAGMQFVLGDAPQRAAACPKGVIVNMSLGGYKTKAMNAAAAAIVSAGLFLAVAAGNDGEDSIGYSPASEPSVCTVGATAFNDTFAPWSNHGPLVDILAPGVDITSTWIGGGIETLSGTSMATPHIAGLGAYLLGLGAKADNLCGIIAGMATKDAIDPRTMYPNTVNLLAWNGAQGSSRYGNRRVKA
ncbi:hypothetical protein PTNB85_02541 [Pyrenophora teres f. teres]|nr:hypothetical protein HRS9139_02698 [Pyrenophora teres f. teres]KAE8844276.1 hypothetical protein PTNB85_02541 [Pyrenophora teres f. teres]KAE8847521.1 hypothetical protein HRS9122_04428 [Pyrenophora teres f. teres]KAE8866578.1 hypothetical protein PTNB29_03725 [Pyrenophora teres f. teres]CAE7179966.1 Serine protease [Pyrenophora teres f. teres]